MLCGVEQDGSKLKRTTHCRYSYAIHLDNLSDIDQERSTPSQLLYMLDEGDLVLADVKRIVEREFEMSFSRSPSTVVPFPIYRYKGEDRPTRFRLSMDGMLRCYHGKAIR